MIAQAELILAASVTERAALAHLEPTARGRTFTLAEAAVLARRWAEGPPSAADPPHLGALADYMHRQRGTASLPVARKRILRPQRDFGLNIPDVHMGEIKRHSTVHNLTAAAVSSLIAATRGGLRLSDDR